MKPDPKMARWLLSPWGAGLLISLLAFAGIGYWLSASHNRMQLARWLGLESVALRTFAGPSSVGTTSMKPIDLLLEAYRADTSRVDRWRLRMPAAYVSTVMAKADRQDTNSYYLDLVLGSDEPASIVSKRLREQRKAQKLPPAIGPNEAVIKVIVERAYLRTPTEVARNRFEEYDGNCRNAGLVHGGLTQFQRYGDDERPTSVRAGGCSAGPGILKFAAGSSVGMHELSIAWIHGSSGPLIYCKIEPIIMHGWGVRVLRFDPKHLSRWREIIRQVVSFLEAHTVESTTGLPSSNLDWL